MNTRRKEKLKDRAIAYGKRKHSDKTLTVVWTAADGFEDGYRAAMSDMRKELKHAEVTGDPSLPAVTKFARLLGTVRNFLLPLR